MSTYDLFPAKIETMAREHRQYKVAGMGGTQWSILRSLCENGSWSRGSGWVWDNPSGTIKLLDSLVKRGLATREDIYDERYPLRAPRPRFTPKPRVSEIWHEVKRRQNQERHERWAQEEAEQEQRRRAADIKRRAEQEVLSRHMKEVGDLIAIYTAEEEASAVQV